MKGVHWIDTGQWPSGLAITDSEDAYRRFMRAYCGKDAECHNFPTRNGGLCQHLNDDNGGSLLIILIGRQSSREELVCTIAHEATHAMRWMLEHVGEKMPGTETEAYLVEHIVRHGLRALNKRKPKPRQ